jgi:hypothetical protein
MTVDLTVLKAYLDAGKRVFPVTAYDDPDAEEKYRGKKPQVKDWRNAQSPETLEVFSRSEAGMALEADDLIVDVDPRNGGEESLVKLNLYLGFDLEDIASVKVFSGRSDGGRHLYFKKDAHTPVRKNLKEYPGIDFLCDRNYVVTAGSLHAATGKPYHFSWDSLGLKDLSPAPGKLIDLILKRESDVSTIGEGKEVEVREYNSNPVNIRRAEEFARTLPPAVEGRNGDDSTYRFFCRMQDLGLHPKEAFSVFREHFNPRCEPPWSEKDAVEKMRNAYTYAESPLGHKSVEKILLDMFAEDTPAEEAAAENDTWMDTLEYITKESPFLKAHSQRNIDLILAHHPQFANLFAHNAFDGDIYLMRVPPWDKAIVKRKYPLGFPEHGRPYADDDLAGLRLMLMESSWRFDVSPEKIHNSILSISRKNWQHPVLGFLKSLEWDGKPRLSKWLHDYCGVEDTPLSRAFAEKTLFGAIARVETPGIKFDTMLVLEGEQEKGKSAIIQALADPWFEDNMPDIRDKDAIEQLRGKWIVEIAEMDAANRAEITALKAFLSRPIDRARLAYERRATAFPRQSIFIGTTNLYRYLRDTTGNRRFWPVKVGHIDLEGFKKVSGQIWAEAYHRFHTQKPLIYLTGDLRAQAKKEQRLRLLADPWETRIRKFLKGDNATEKVFDEVTQLDLWNMCLGQTTVNLTIPIRNRLSDVMRALDWEETTVEGDVYYIRNKN